jgi:hypothetical protein
VSIAVPETATAVPVPGEVAELEEAVAITVTVPDAPEMHCAKPLWLIVATCVSETDQLPE